MGKKLTIEVTSNCNAKCFSCSRYNNNESIVKNINLDFDVYKQVINDIGEELRFIIFDGSFGDSPIHPQFLEMVKYVVDICPWIKIDISTNGSYKGVDFWAELGNILSTVTHKVSFALDGIDNETQNMYRSGTNFDKIIENARAFIGAGGKATWKMIPFNFNVELEEQGKVLAEKYGFNTFQRTRTTRYKQKAFKSLIAQELKIKPKDLNDKELALFDPKVQKDSLDSARKSVGVIEVDTTQGILENLEALLEPKTIVCKWADDDSYVISHDGKVWRCCWHDANYHYEKSNNNDRNQYLHYVNKYEPHWNSVYYNSINDIINHDFFMKDLPESFDNSYNDPFNPKLKVCSDKCSIL